jgi:hypothetical protein
VLRDEGPGSTGTGDEDPHESLRRPTTWEILGRAGTCRHVQDKGHKVEQAYEAPKADVIGTVAGLTRGQSRGQFLDADFPEGTPFQDLTFS